MNRYLFLPGGDRGVLRTPKLPKRRRMAFGSDAGVDRRLYALGVAIAIAAVPFHQPLLLIIGLLILIVTGTTEIWGRYCLQDLDYKREFSEKRVLFGEEVTLSLSVENAKLLPLPWLETEDSVPSALVYPDRHMRISVRSNSVVFENLFSILPYERVTRRYTIQCVARGVHTFGPTVLRSGDVFGFLNREVSLPNWQYLLVYPMIVPLTRFGLPARHPFGDFRAPRRLLEDPLRVIGVRDYSYGDGLRRIHWKATARTMQLQSKIYEPTTTFTLVIFLNVVSQLDAYYGINPELQELSICAAASVADWALDQGFAVGLYANTIMYMPEVGLSADEEWGKDTPQDGTHEGVGTSIAPLSGARGSGASINLNLEGEGQSGLRTVIEDQLKRRRIHLPPASNEEQRKRIMEVLARVQSYFGSSIEDVIQTERTRLPAGSTIVVITSTIGELLLDSLTRMRQSGHAVTVLYAGDTSLPTRLAGATVYHIGGEETWKELLTAHTNAIRTDTIRTDTIRTGVMNHAPPAGFSF
jgi:uncharacterized protein (DUF58 family)